MRYLSNKEKIEMYLKIIHKDNINLDMAIEEYSIIVNKPTIKSTYKLVVKEKSKFLNWIKKNY